MKIEKPDEWGRDPSVQAMRKVFKRMERDQAGFLGLMNISRLDPRLRAWREKALVMFERLGALASQRGMMVNEKTAGDIYVHSLAKVMAIDGTEVDKGLLPENSDVEMLVEEFLK